MLSEPVLRVVYCTCFTTKILAKIFHFFHFIYGIDSAVLPAFEWLLMFCYYNMLHLLYTADTAKLNGYVIDQFVVDSIV